MDEVDKCGVHNWRIRLPRKFKSVLNVRKTVAEAERYERL